MYDAGSVASERAEVLVIGAGTEGLAAARELTRRGTRELGLEAPDRIGGRICTDRSLGRPLDLGASWIHRAHGNPLNVLAKEFGARRLEADYRNIAGFDGAHLSGSPRRGTSKLLDSRLGVQIVARDPTQSVALESLQRPPGRSVARMESFC